MRLSAKKVWFIYSIIVLVIFTGIFCLNFFKNKIGFLYSLTAGAMYSLPIALIGAGSGLGIILLDDANNSYETNTKDTEGRRYFENSLRKQK